MVSSMTVMLDYLINSLVSLITSEPILTVIECYILIAVFQLLMYIINRHFIK